MSFLISTAYAATNAVNGTAGVSQQNPMFGTISMILLFGVFIWFFMWRPQTKRAKQHRDLITSLKSGDEVITNGGIAGKLSKIEESFVVIQIAANAEVRFQKAAISGILPKGTLKF